LLKNVTASVLIGLEKCSWKRQTGRKYFLCKFWCLEFSECQSMGIE